MLLKDRDKTALARIYEEKKRELASHEQHLHALEEFLSSHNTDQLYASVDYSTIAQAIQDMFPGFYGYFFMQHFLPYLQIPLKTKAQEEAYHAVLAFWDNASIRIPWFLRISSWLLYRLTPQAGLESRVRQMEQTIQMYLNPSEEEYQRLLEQTRKHVRLKNSPLFRYHPAFVSQRRFMRRLKDCGYNDIFIPNMMALSPKYRKYHDALTAINERICRDLGLYYDSNYHLIMKNDSQNQR